VPAQADVCYRILVKVDEVRWGLNSRGRLFWEKEIRKKKKKRGVSTQQKGHPVGQVSI